MVPPGLGVCAPILRHGQSEVLVFVIILVFLLDQGIVALQLVLGPEQMTGFEWVDGDVLSLHSHALVEFVAVVGLLDEEVLVFLVAGDGQTHGEEGNDDDVEESEEDLSADELGVECCQDDGADVDDEDLMGGAEEGEDVEGPELVDSFELGPGAGKGEQLGEDDHLELVVGEEGKASHDDKEYLMAGVADPLLESSVAAEDGGLCHQPDQVYRVDHGHSHQQQQELSFVEFQAVLRRGRCVGGGRGGRGRSRSRSGRGYFDGEGAALSSVIVDLGQVEQTDRLQDAEETVGCSHQVGVLVLELGHEAGDEKGQSHAGEGHGEESSGSECLGEGVLNTRVHLASVSVCQVAAGAVAVAPAVQDEDGRGRASSAGRRSALQAVGEQAAALEAGVGGSLVILSRAFSDAGGGVEEEGGVTGGARSSSIGTGLAGGGAVEAAASLHRGILIVGALAETGVSAEEEAGVAGETGVSSTGTGLALGRTGVALHCEVIGYGDQGRALHQAVVGHRVHEVVCDARLALGGAAIARLARGSAAHTHVHYAHPPHWAHVHAHCRQRIEVEPTHARLASHSTAALQARGHAGLTGKCVGIRVGEGRAPRP